jgi:hypothetical protein
VRRHDVRDAVQQRGEVSGEVRVPRVECTTSAPATSPTISRSCRASAPRGWRTAARPVRRRTSCRPRRGRRRTRAPAPRCSAQRRDEFGDVDTRTAVDLGRVLLGDDVDAHVTNASTRSNGA